MHNPSKMVCEKCTTRVPKNRPKLVCSMCKSYKHYKCNNLTKRDAYEIIINRDYEWICHDCLAETLPINVYNSKVARTNHSKNGHTEPPIKCSACKKCINKSICICCWCDKPFHP